MNVIKTDIEGVLIIEPRLLRMREAISSRASLRETSTNKLE